MTVMIGIDPHLRSRTAVAVDGNDIVYVGDNDGVLVVPSWMAEAALEHAIEHEEAENYIKEKIKAENVAPGTYSDA